MSPPRAFFPYEQLSDVAHMFLDMLCKLLTLSVHCTDVTLLIVICDLVMIVVVIDMKVAMRIVSIHDKVERVSRHVRHVPRHHVADNFYRRTSSTSAVQVRPHACRLLSLSTPTVPCMTHVSNSHVCVYVYTHFYMVSQS